MYLPVPHSLLGDLNSIYAQNTSLFYLFFIFYERCSALANSILGFLNSISWEKAHVLFFFFFYDRFPAITNSILGFLNSNNSEMASSFHFFTFFFMKCPFLFPIVSTDFPLVSTYKTIYFLTFFNFFINGSLLFSIVSSNFSTVLSEKRIVFLLFFLLLWNILCCC